MKKKRYILFQFTFLFFTFTALQEIKAQALDSAEQKQIPQVFSEVKGYIGIIHPIYTFSGDGNSANFSSYYLVGNPWGINLWKTRKFGFSFEFAPFIRADKHGVKMSNFLFHPGILYKLPHDFTFIARAAFETSGRFGYTPVLNRVIYRNKNYSFFTAIMLPVRYGNSKAPSYSPGFQIGIGF